ncbi:hypothetical protein U1Q18_037797, partial [Sarracenia purpurea var. burkii]
ALKRETKFPVSACNGRSEGLDVRSKRGLRRRDFFEEGRQLEEIAVRALNQAKQGIKPLSKGDVMYFETWLAKYRASSQIAPHSIPSAAKTTAGKEVFHVEGTVEVKEKGAEYGAKGSSGFMSSDLLKYEGIPDARATELGSSSDVPFSDKNCSQSGVSESGKGDSCDDGVAGDEDSEVCVDRKQVKSSVVFPKVCSPLCGPVSLVENGTGIYDLNDVIDLDKGVKKIGYKKNGQMFARQVFDERLEPKEAAGALLPLKQVSSKTVGLDFEHVFFFFFFG